MDKNTKIREVDIHEYLPVLIDIINTGKDAGHAGQKGGAEPDEGPPVGIDRKISGVKGVGDTETAQDVPPRADQYAAGHGPDGPEDRRAHALCALNRWEGFGLPPIDQLRNVHLQGLGNGGERLHVGGGLARLPARDGLAHHMELLGQFVLGHLPGGTQAF